jgi:hypothetical protein
VDDPTLFVVALVLLTVAVAWWRVWMEKSKPPDEENGLLGDD